MTETRHGLDALLERTVRSTFEASPALARYSGDHRFDGVLPPVGVDAVRRRLAQLDEELAAIEAVDRASLDTEAVADLGTARHAVLNEHFHLAVLRDPSTSATWALGESADVWGTCVRDYAPAAERAAAVCRQLEALPEWLGEAARLLDDELPTGPRDIGVGMARGFATFYRDDVRTMLGDLGDAQLATRLDRAIETGAAACERHATLLESRPTGHNAALGAEVFCAMLEAQEGIEETAPALRARVDAELERLRARSVELAGEIGASSVLEAFHRIEAERATAETLIATTAGMLDRLRDFWLERAVVTVPTDVGCTVVPSPPFYNWITAAYENPGPLDPPGLPHFYFVTPVDPAWSPEQAEQWLSHLNLPSLENISVHEAYPGHFVHFAAVIKRRGHIVRSIQSFSGFTEGWAHYTELLAIEQGLAEGRPLVEVAMLQDALLRVCRFSATIGMHTEGMSLEDATRLFEAEAHIPPLAAEREAIRGTYDPMYLVYTYGKLEILRWREELSRRPGFDLRRFHDRMITSGAPPLAVVRDYVLAAAED